MTPYQYALCGLVLCCTILLCVCADDRIRAEETQRNNQDAQSYVDKWKQRLDALKLIQFSSSFVDWTEYEDGTRTEDNQLSVDWIVDFSNKRYWSGTLTHAVSNEKYSSEDRVIGEKALSVSKYTIDDELEVGVISNVNPIDGLWEKTLGLLYWSFPFGYVEDGRTRFFIPDILKSAKLELSMKDHSPVLHGTTSNLIITVEFDSEECRYAKFLEVKKIAKEENPNLFQECRFVVNRVEECNGVYIPVEYDVVKKTNGGKVKYDKIPHGYIIEDTDFPPRTFKANVKLENIVFPETLSDDDFKISMTIPDYTPVYMEDARHIEHIWRDGKAVPLTDELALERARGHGFMPGPDEPRFWLMGVGIALIVCSGGVKIYQYFKNRKDK